MKSRKKAKVDNIGPKIEEIEGILSNPDCDVSGPSGNTDLLVSALPHALGSYSDERHQYQKTVAGMIGEVMNGWVSKWEGKLKEAKEAVDTTASDKVAAEASQESAKSSLAAEKENVKTCKENLKAAVDAEKGAASELTAANKEVAEFDEGLKTTVAEKDNIEKIFNEGFLVMKAAESADALKASKSHMSEVSKTVKKIATEASLQIAIVSALKKTTAERGEFDKMAIDGVEASFKSKLEKLGAEIAEAGTTKAAKEGVAAEKKTAHDATEAKRQECIAALKATEEAKTEKEKALVAAEKTTEAAEKAANKAVRTQNHEQRGLDHAKGNLATFAFLLERSTPPPPPAEEAEPQAAA